METIGDQIRRAREALGLSRRDLSAATSVSERTINRIESGEAASDRSVQPLLRHLRLGAYADHSGPRLLDASHAELLNELARRLGAQASPNARNTPVSDSELEWPLTSGPSQRNQNHPDELPDVDDNGS